MREEEEKKKKEEEEEKKVNGDKAQTGASSKGTNTPSGRHEKHSDPLRSKASAANLKRPGSPNLSDASGSESTHKRVKKLHNSSSQPSRPMSPSIPDGARSLSRKSLKHLFCSLTNHLHSRLSCKPSYTECGLW